MKITKAVTVTLLAAECQELLAVVQFSVLTQLDFLIPLQKQIYHIFPNYVKLLLEFSKMKFPSCLFFPSVHHRDRSSVVPLSVLLYYSSVLSPYISSDF